MDLNKVQFIGNIVNDPESRTTTGGTATSKFRLATNRVWTNQQGQKQEDAQFHNITAFGKLAEICNQYLRRGQKIYVEGRLQHSTFQGQDGQTRYWTEVIIENMIMLSAGKGMASGSQSVGQSQAAPNTGFNQTQSVQPQTISNAPGMTAQAAETPTISPDEPAHFSDETSTTEIKEKEEKPEEEINVEDIPF